MLKICITLDSLSVAFVGELSIDNALLAVEY